MNRFLGRFQYLKPIILAATLVVMLVAFVTTSTQAHSISSPLQRIGCRFIDVNEGDSFVVSVDNVVPHGPSDNPDNFDVRWSTYARSLNYNDFAYARTANSNDFAVVNQERQVGTYE